MSTKPATYEWTASRKFGNIVLTSTKEIFLLRKHHPNGQITWVLDISAYGQCWREDFEKLDDAKKYLVDLWEISNEFWNGIVESAEDIQLKEDDAP